MRVLSSFLIFGNQRPSSSKSPAGLRLSPDSHETGKTMDSEASSFETSEMLGTFLTSTLLPKEAWRLCGAASRMGDGGLVAEQVGGVRYVAFSSVQDLPMLGRDPSFGVLVSLDVAGNGLFAPLKCRDDGEEPVMVHSGMLHLFLRYHSRLDFQSQIGSLLGNSESIVITGHSVGGSIAFLTALWLLSQLKPVFPPISVLCIAFGSPFLGNESLSQAIIREKWGGSLCNIVSMLDIMPRLPLDQWQVLMRFWYTSMTMTSPNSMNMASLQLPEDGKAGLFSSVAADMERLTLAGEGSGGRSFWPFGNYLFCSDEGAICLDNAVSINKMMHLMLGTGSPNCIVEEHLKYGQYVDRLSLLSLRRSSMGRALSESSYEASLSMALYSLGTYRQVSIAPMAKDWLKMARRLGCAPNINAANLAIKLSRITPYRAEIEWYKACCDDSHEQRGYYDSFKQRGASKKEYKINMNRFKLAAFWDDVIQMIDKKELPHDLHKRSKWMYGSWSYMLLVEPLDIAEYYRLGTHLKKGHYISNGRPRRYEIFDHWRAEGVISEKPDSRRTRFASLTQDSCFWARVEEAKEWLDHFRSQSDPRNLDILRVRLDDFETYALKLVNGKEVSADVVAKNSSFNLWLKEWRASKSQIVSQSMSVV